MSVGENTPMHSSTKVRIALRSFVLLTAPVSGNPLGREVGMSSKCRGKIRPHWPEPARNLVFVGK